MQCSNPGFLPEVRDFMHKTSDFLEPMNDRDVACAMGLCYGPRQCEPEPKLFKCKVGDNNVRFSTFNEGDFQNARETCAARSDLHVEPVGGAGHLIIDPTPDHNQAAQLFTEASQRLMRRTGYKTALRVLVGVLVLQLVLLMLNHAI